MSLMSLMRMVLNTDGGARGNPGPGAAGIVLQDESGKVIKEIGKFLGKCTNNEAEYQALILGFITAKKAGADFLECHLDSQLVVKQLNGLYKVKNPKMQKLFAQVKKLEKDFDFVVYKKVPREKNKKADKLVNEVLDSL